MSTELQLEAELASLGTRMIEANEALMQLASMVDFMDAEQDKLSAAEFSDEAMRHYISCTSYFKGYTKGILTRVEGLLS